MDTLATSDYFWIIGGLAGAGFIAWLRHKIFMRRLDKVSKAHRDKTDKINAQWDSLHSNHDAIWSDCDFGVLTEDTPAFDFIHVLNLPGHERYKIYMAVKPNDGKTLEELFLDDGVDADSSVTLNLGGALGAYSSTENYTTGVWSDGRQDWGISIRDMQHSIEDVERKRNYPPQADLRYVWEQVALHVKLSSSQTSLNALQESVEAAAKRLREKSVEERNA